MDLSFLRGVEKPTRYTGGEVNEVVKDGEALLHVALAFPEAYEIGMSHLGLKILYKVLNDREDLWAERVFMPMPDMEEALRQRGLPLYGLESKRPLSDFDVVGFSLLFELTYTNVLHMLDMGGIPRRAAERDGSHPLVIAGGPCAANPEPVADFFDAILIGDGEEAVLEICDAVKGQGREDRDSLLTALASIEGVYVPSFYEVRPAGTAVIPEPAREGASFPVHRRILPELEAFAYPRDTIVPHHEVVHDRYNIELARGCAVGCRFCQAGFFYRPYRERPAGAVRACVSAGLHATGFNEVTLLSLNAGEYEGIESLSAAISADGEESRVGVALPSLRVSAISEDLVRALSSGRKSGFTLAPEAGTQRLRDVINKKVTEEDLMRAVEEVFRAGWKVVKLYFMIGLPTESDEDVAAIADLARKAVEAARATGCDRPKVTVSVSSFVPKPFTPFQWCAMDRPEDLRRKQEMLKGLLRRPAEYRWHDVPGSLVEAAFSLGDRRLCGVLDRAAALGCRLDGWTERFRWDLWRQAFDEADLDIAALIHETRNPEEPLPWDVVGTGVHKSFLLEEWQRALKAETTATCGPERCHGCADFAERCMGEEFVRPQERAAEAPRTVEPSPRREDDPKRLRREIRIRYRMAFSKLGPSVFLGHLDLVETLVRAFRRCRIPLLYSRGYHPMPKVELCAPLPLGVEGHEEWVDFEVNAELDRLAILSELGNALPRGLDILSLAPLAEGFTPLSAFSAHVYRIGLEGLEEAQRVAFEDRLGCFLDAETWPVIRKKKRKTREVDLKSRLLSARKGADAVYLTLRTGGFKDILDALSPTPHHDRLGLARVRLLTPASRGRVAASGDIG